MLRRPGVAVFVVAALLVGVSAGGASSKSSAGNSTEIYSVNPDGSDRVNLSQNAATDLFPVESPRGGRIAFVSGRDGYDAIYVTNDDGSEQHRRWLALRGGDSTYVVTRDGRFLRRVGGPASEPAWNPNSSHVAWADESLGGVAVTSPRSQATFLAIPSTAIYGLTWTRDSRRLIFASAPIGYSNQSG